MKAKIFYIFIILFFVFNKVKATEFLPVDTFIVFINNTSIASQIILNNKKINFNKIAFGLETSNQKLEFKNENFKLSDFFIVNDTIKRNKITAIILTLLTGPVGGHRLYMGTKPIVPIVYACTLGCIGILPFIDLVVICFSKDLSRFENNDKIIMWAN